MGQRQESPKSIKTKDQSKAAKPRSDINLKKIKEILTMCHDQTDKKLKELVDKCVKNNV